MHWGQVANHFFACWENTWELAVKEDVDQCSLIRHECFSCTYCMYVHTLDVHAHTLVKLKRCVPLICCKHWVEGGSGTVHRTHSRGEQCCLLASPVSALHPAPQTDYPDPLTRFVFVDVDCWATSVDGSTFIYMSGPLLSSLYMQLPICNDSVDIFNVADQSVMFEIG